MLYGLEVLQIEQLTFQQAEKVFNHCIFQTVAFSAHALVDSLFLEYSLVLFVLVLPTLIGVKDEFCSVRYRFKCFVQPYLDHSFVSNDSRMLRGAVERLKVVFPVCVFASVLELPAFFALASPVFQNQGLQVF